MLAITLTAVASLLSLALPASAVAATEGSTYTISPKKFPDMCLAPVTPTNGALLTLKPCDTSDDIVWQWSGQSWHNPSSNKCIDIRDGGAWNGNQPQVWDCFSYNTNQMYILPNEQIQWAGQNFCMDLTDGNGNAGVNMQIWNCFDHNDNQMWELTDAEEVDDCDGTTGSITHIPSATIAPSASANVNASSIALPSPSANGTNATIIGDQHLVQLPSASSSHYHHATASPSPAPSPSPSAAWGATVSPSPTGTVSVVSSATPSPSAASSYNPGSGSGSFAGTGALRTSGTQVVDSTGKQVILKGTNLGGWLVFEDWMCGITDYTDSGDRFPQWTLENRFGQAQTKDLMNTWMDNWLVAADFDKLKALGFTVARLPFSFKNFINTDGSDNDVGFTRLDWAISQAKRVGIYLIPVYHIWDTQKERYSMISENTDEGQAARDKAGALWKKIAARYVNEETIAAYDAINEPTGSWGDLLQQQLYTAIRSVDSNRIIIQASLSTNPSNYGWTNVIYTQHEYQMMGSDYGSNMAAYSAGPAAAIADFSGLNIPTYIGEFMADGPTLTSLLSNLNQANVWWSSWTLHTVQMDRWGLYNYSNQMQVDVSNDSFDSIKSQWSNMGGLTRQAIADQFQSACGASSWKREEKREVVVPKVMASPKVGRAHGGRSRSTLRHRALAAKSI